MNIRFCIAAVLLTTSGLLAAQPDAQFAAHLFDEQEYRWAQLEYDRLIFLGPDSSAAPFWRLRLGLSTMHTNQYTAAFRHFRGIFTDHILGDSARLYAAECALRFHYPDTARALLEHCRLDAGSVLLGYADFELCNYPSALTALAPIPDSSPFAYKAAALKKIIQDVQGFKPKQYFPAAALAIIPGLGHVYTGRNKDGLSSFLTISTGALITGYYAYFGGHAQAYAAGTITGLLYAGSIYGAVMSVKIYNRDFFQEQKANAERIVFDK